MDPKRLVTKEQFGQRLKRLRQLKFSDEDAGEFRKLAEIAHTQFTNVESGRSYLLPHALERWLSVCGTSLSRFFSEWEAEKFGGRDALRIMRTHEDLYRLLTEILETRDKERIRSIAMILQDAVNTLRATPGEVKKPPHGSRHGSRTA